MADSPILFNHFQQSRVTHVLIFGGIHLSYRRGVCDRGEASGAVGMYGPIGIALANELWFSIGLHLL